jgi:hypothetical protein
VAVCSLSYILTLSAATLVMDLYSNLPAAKGEAASLSQTSSFAPAVGEDRLSQHFAIMSTVSCVLRFA